MTGRTLRRDVTGRTLRRDVTGRALRRDVTGPAHGPYRAETGMRMRWRAGAVTRTSSPRR